MQGPPAVGTRGWRTHSPTFSSEPPDRAAVRIRNSKASAAKQLAAIQKAYTEAEAAFYPAAKALPDTPAGQQKYKQLFKEYDKGQADRKGPLRTRVAPTATSRLRPAQAAAMAGVAKKSPSAASSPASVR